MHSITLHAGTTIKSTTDLNGTFFENSVIVLTEVNENGAMGFTINKSFNRKLNHLVEFSLSLPFPLNDGGPVDQEHLYFIHRRPDVITGGTPITNNMFMGGDFKQAVAAINNHTLTQNDIMIFAGYCGWNKGELETEINEGSWAIIGDLKLSGFDGI